MANSTVSSKGSSSQVQWMWDASVDPFSADHSSEWRPYSLADNKIIERAYSQGQTQTMLNDYHIDLKKQLQISKSDANKQRPIKRFITDVHQNNSDEGHFVIDLISPPARAHNGQYGWIPIFIKAAAKDLNLTRQQLPSKDRMSIPKIVERAVLGIIEESEALGGRAVSEGKEIADQLRATKNQTMAEVWRCCAQLYTGETFLYKLMNETMRMIGRPGQEQLWQSKVRTLGPYSLLLWDNPSCVEPSTVQQPLYRGIYISEEEFESFRTNSSGKSRPEYSFQAFTSTSRTPRVALIFGNALLTITVKMAFTVDLAPIARGKAEEEEELIMPGVCFIVKSVEDNKRDGKYHIELELNQRHRQTDLLDVKKNASPAALQKDNAIHSNVSSGQLCPLTSSNASQIPVYRNESVFSKCQTPRGRKRGNSHFRTFTDVSEIFEVYPLGHLSIAKSSSK